MHKKHRVFIAINLPGDVKKYLAGLEKKYHDVPARWTSTENLHITLSFLGYLSDTEIGEVSLAVKGAVAKHGPFEISLNKVCYGPVGKNPPRMIWLVGEKSKELSALRRDIENALAQRIHFKPEARSFNPHITLARINMMEFRAVDLEERTEINEDVDLPVEVPSVEIMESELKRGGPAYTIIESHELT